ncbi:hypothetical protein KSP39_PZI004164 [Platanthera zijinensis]|uniref:Acyl carrier protein n=1 Tax=Platanthera zijinensis TaxID=2320716 RepID=A0AAP0BUU2_9ASPA
MRAKLNRLIPSQSSQHYLVPFPYSDLNLQNSASSPSIPPRIHTHLRQNLVSRKANFHSDLGLDSLDTVEVVMALEEEFSLEIPDNEADKISSIDLAVDFISSHPQAKWCMVRELPYHISSIMSDSLFQSDWKINQCFA